MVKLFLTIKERYGTDRAIALVGNICLGHPAFLVARQIDIIIHVCRISF